MAHYKSMFESNGMLYACHLAGRDVTLTIAKVDAGSVTGAKGRKAKKPIITFTERPDLKLALNKTNGKTIAALYGTDTDAWAGRMVTIYPTTTEMEGEQVECIRVRPRIPPAKGAGHAQQKHGDPTPPADGGDAP